MIVVGSKPGMHGLDWKRSKQRAEALCVEFNRKTFEKSRHRTGIERIYSRPRKQ